MNGPNNPNLTFDSPEVVTEADELILAMMQHVAAKHPQPTVLTILALVKAGLHLAVSHHLRFFPELPPVELARYMLLYTAQLEEHMLTTGGYSVESDGTVLPLPNPGSEQQ
jgi:hypothetical protein